MNFKKTLGLVLTAALISSSVVAVKPAKAATTATPVVATAPTQASTLTSFSYFYAQRSLLVAGESNTYVVDTNYNGKVQYELWIQDTADKTGKWQVISKGTDGKPGYTEAVDGQNSPYAIPVVDGFTFKEGSYNVAVYAKVAGTAGTQTRGHYIDATTGVDTDSKSGTEQKYDILTTGRFRAENASIKQKYNEMLGDFIFDQDANSFVAGKKVTFKGFSSQKDGAKYKFLVRKLGADYGTQTVINDAAYASTVDWTPKDAGTYEIIAWSEPTVNKSAGLDGWRIGYATVKPAVTTPTVDASTIKLSAGMLPGQTMVKLQLTGVTDPSTCTVKFNDKTFKYDATQKLFYANVDSADQTLLAKAGTYTVTVTSAPVPSASVDASTIKLSAGMLPGQTMVKLQLAGSVDPSAYTVKFNDKVFKYDATQKLFYANVDSADQTALAKAEAYTVVAK